MADPTAMQMIDNKLIMNHELAKSSYLTIATNAALPICLSAKFPMSG